jgi:hypothetical protein
MSKTATTADEIVQIHFRAPAALMKRLDAWAERLNANGYARWTRNALILAACESALEEHGTKGETPERTSPRPMHRVRTKRQATR